MASATERARFRGVKKVDGMGSNHRESYAAEEGGVLSQANFPEPAPRRWDDQVFENRLKHALSQTVSKPKKTPGAGPSSATPRSTVRRPLK